MKLKRILAMILALTMLLTLAAPALAEGENKSVILYTNDVHTNIDKALSYDSIAALKTYYEGLYGDVVLVDAGDHAQGTAYGSMDKGKTIIDLMNAAGYDLATLGNHEFDYGMDGAMNLIGWAQFPYISANFYNEAGGVKGTSVLDAYKIFELGGEKIAFVGITTPESFTKSTPAYFQDGNGNYIYGIAGGTDGAALYADVQAAINAAVAAGATKVIALGHLGVDKSSQPWTSEELIANTTGLSAFIDGHSHSTVVGETVNDKNGNPVLLTQTGEYFGKIGVMIIDHDTGAITTELIGELPTGVTPDATVAAIKNDWIGSIDTQLGEVIGSTELTLDNYDADGARLVRSQETNTGDFAADALYYLFDNMDLDVDVAIMNGGGVRSKAVTGDISYKTCKTIHTFGNVACLQTVTGQQILDALEWGARDVGSAECGGFLQVSGLKYSVKTGVTSTVQKDDKSVWTGGPTSLYRVYDVQVYNKETKTWDALDVNAKYNLAGYNYTLRDLGDGFAMFDGAVNVLDYVMEDYMVLANYVKAFENGVVGATNSPLNAKYAGFGSDYGTINGSGRITIEATSADKSIVLYTNDVHTYIANMDADENALLSYDSIAALKDYYEGLYENVLLVDAGDHIQGTAYGSMDKGKTIIDLMNAAGYDLATLGNHEFDYGMDGAKNVFTNWANYPYVSANFYNEAEGVRGENVLPAYKIFEHGSEKIAIIGITTPESFTKSTPAYFQDGNGNYIYGISGGTDGAALYADVQAAIDAAVAAGATKVIALGHLGDDESSKPWTSAEVIANTTGLSAFIDGHSHSTVVGETVNDKNGNPVLLTQTGEYFGKIGVMTIDHITGAITTELITELPAGVTADTSVTAIKDAWIASIDEQLGEVIGSTELTLDNYDANGNRIVRTQETNTGDFAADALYYLFDNMDMDVDVAIMNGGGIRNSAITGDISYLICKKIHTFGNVACLQTVTGQQILDALEWGAREAPAVQVGGFLQVSGLRYSIDATVTNTVQADDKGVWIGGPTGEYRVHDVKVYNKETKTWDALDVNAKYNLAGYNYTLRDLGDGFAMFDGAVNVLDYVMEDYMVLANYVKAFENSVVGATNSPLNAKYAGFGSDYATVNGSGRITIKTSDTPEVWDGKVTIGGLDNNIWMTKYGNVYTDCKAENFTQDLGLAWGDLVTVKFLNKTLILPVVPDYSYVDTGKPAIILAKTELGTPALDSYISLAINMGSFAETYELAHKHVDSNKNWSYTAWEGVSYPVEVTYELAEKEGYMAEYLLRDLQRTNDRADYPNLTDEQFANFRPVVTTGDKIVLYRTSSPINPEIGRNEYADAAIEKAGVTVIMNLADNKADAEAYPGFADTYYADQNVIYLSLGVDFQADEFKAGLAEGLRFFANNKGTYAVHCTEGKDRAGFVIALLECLMGASYDEVIADYMVTYTNYYGVEPGTDKYTAIANSNIVKSLSTAFGVSDLASANLTNEAIEYLKAIGLNDTEIENLRVNLGKAPAVQPGGPSVTPSAPATSPDTGDEGIAVYVCLMAFAVLGSAVLFGYSKKKSL